ncbi:MAG: flagellar hook-associated protein FlgK [Lachnospiraceae bacterium]|nr:flagellar hook-associated protein FlgK [Lachnospiraceae bacterium]
MSLFSGLYTGASGLVTNQNALNTTAHNLANINTSGYTRQQVTQGNRHYDTIGQSYVSSQQVGLGVSYSDVRAVRDYFLDKAYRLENGRSEYYNANYQIITEMETLFGEMEGVAFQESMVELERTIQELQKNPSDATNQGLLVSKATTFLERSQAVYDGIAGYQDNLNEQIKGLVDDINKYAKQIDELNHKITAIETGGIERANDLRDMRDMLLDKLSGLGNISYEENIHGVVTVQFEGVDLVSDDFAYEMAAMKKEEIIKTNPDLKETYKDLDDDFYIPVWKSLGCMSVISRTETISSDLNTDVGALKAVLNARGDKRGTYRDLYRAQDYLDEYKLEDIQKPVAERRFFDGSTPPKQIKTDEEIIATITPELNDRYDKTTLRSSVVNMMAEFDNLIHGIVTGMNNILTGENGYTLFSQITVPDEPKDSEKTKYKNYDNEDAEIVPASMADSTDGWSTKNLMITTAVQQVPSLLNDGFVLPDKSVNQADADKLVDLFQDDFDILNPNTRKKHTFAEYYNALATDNAIRGNTYKNVSDNQSVTVSSLDNQRQQVVGVSDEEELTLLIKYQNAYNASSRYINVLNQMLETLLSSMGR